MALASPLEVLAGSDSAKAVEIVASVTTPDCIPVTGPRFPDIVACGNGSGTSSLLDRCLHRRLFSVEASRALKRPVRCRVTDRRLSSMRIAAPPGSGRLRVDEQTSAQAELDSCHATLRSPQPSEDQHTLELDIGVAALNTVDIPSKAGADSLLYYLEAQQGPIVLVVGSALEEKVDDRPGVKDALHQMQLHRASHAQVRPKMYLVLSKIDKVLEEDVQAQILDRLLAGLLPAADGTNPGASAGLAAEPCLADFDGIFAVVSGHPKKEPGPELAAYEATKLESILEMASGHAEYAPHMAALQSRLGFGALWEHIVGQDLDQHSLRWLQDEQVPRMEKHLEAMEATHDAMPIEQPSMQAVLADVTDKVKQLKYHLRQPYLDRTTLAGLTSKDITPFLTMAGPLAIKGLISRGDCGQQHTDAWALVSPQLRKVVQDCGSASSVMIAAEEYLNEAIKQAFRPSNDAGDRLCISRFAGLLAQLTEHVLQVIIQEERDEHGDYINSVQRQLIAQWHLDDGPVQVCAKVQAAVSDMARESVVRCLPKVLHPNSVLGIELQEDEATATQRATLISMRGRLLVALCSAREIDA